MMKIENKQYFTVICYTIALFIGSVGSFALSAIFPERGNTYIFLSYLVPQVCYILTVLVLGKSQGKTVHDFLQKKNVKLLPYFLAIIIAVGIFAVAILPNYYVQMLIAKLQSSSTVTVPTFTSPWDYVIGTLVICILPACGEELIFRKCFCDGLQGAKEYKIVLLGGLFFSLSHMNLAQTVHQFVLGCILCFLYLRTQNITLTMVVHCVNNVLALYIEQITGAEIWQETLVLAISFGIGVILLAGSLLLLMKFTKKREETGTKVDKITVGLLIAVAVLWALNVAVSFISL